MSALSEIVLYLLRSTELKGCWVAQLTSARSGRIKTQRTGLEKNIRGVWEEMNCCQTEILRPKSSPKKLESGLCFEVSAAMPKSRQPLMIGWEAARANAKPALIIQALMLALAISFYANSTMADALRNLAEFKRAHGIVFVFGASVIAGALLPELFLILFFQRGLPQIGNLRNLAFTVPVWGFDGSLLDLLYHTEATWLGDVATLPVVLGKICIDQFGYNVLFAAPFGVLTYEWKNSGISMRPVRDLF